MQNIMKKAGFYDPYLDVLGGGERYLLSIAKVLGERGYQFFIFWDTNLDKQIENRFHLDLHALSYLPDLKRINLLQKIRMLRSFDLFFYITDGSYTFTSAKKNYVYAMIPQKSLYSFSAVDRLKLNNTEFITHSQFNRQILESWQIQSKILYPYIDLADFSIRNIKKKPIILSVGRFFGHLHTKQHEQMIDWFDALRQTNSMFKDYKLILAGGLKTEDQQYFNSLMQKTKKNPSIELKPNISYNELVSLYGDAKFFWHFTGLGFDETKNPEKVEHLGITPLEAMAAGCTVYCYNAGGPKEFIQDGSTGFLFSSKHELFKKMNEIVQDKNSPVAQNAQSYIRTTFSYDQFKSNVKKLFL